MKYYHGVVNPIIQKIIIEIQEIHIIKIIRTVKIIIKILRIDQW